MDCGRAGVNPERCVGHRGVRTSDLQTEKVFFVALVVLDLDSPKYVLLALSQ
jgi:hypothetical protein